MTEAALDTQDPIFTARAAEAEELRARLEAAQARRAAATPKPDEIAQLRERVELEERAARNDEAVADAIAKHGKEGVSWARIAVPDGRLILVKRPNPVAVKAFLDLEKITVEETERLVQPCVIFPSVSEYNTIGDEFPGVVQTCGVRVCGLAGMRKAELTGKA